MSQTDIEKLRAELREAKEHLSDLTRNVDESPAFEQDDVIYDKIQRARERVIELERKLAELEQAG